ncbi:hypothetical protein STEG23_018340, partial [Scotinomys teguina]
DEVNITYRKPKSSKNTSKGCKHYSFEEMPLRQIVLNQPKPLTLPPSVVSCSGQQSWHTIQIFEIVDYDVTDGPTDLRLFAVLASLAPKNSSTEKPHLQRLEILQYQTAFSDSIMGQRNENSSPLLTSVSRLCSAVFGGKYSHKILWEFQMLKTETMGLRVHFNRRVAWEQIQQQRSRSIFMTGEVPPPEPRYLGNQVDIDVAMRHNLAPEVTCHGFFDMYSAQISLGIYGRTGPKIPVDAKICGHSNLLYKMV